MLRRIMSVFLICILTASLFPGYIVEAAAIEFTDAIQKQLNATAERATGSNQSKLTKQFNDLKSEQQQTMSWDDKISSLRYANEAKTSETRKRINDIDKDKIRRLEDQLQSAKNKYQPLFNTYTALNKQIATTKKLKDKTLAKMLQTQADSMKLMVTLGKQDIKNKQNALTAAKKAKTSKATKVRSILAEIEPIKSRIKADKSAISNPNKLMQTEWKNFKAAIKAQEPARTADTLSRLVTLSGQILSKKKSIYQYEVKIEDIIKRANTELTRS
ncbi:hypothetical protein JCM10914A_40470 [Paenibacillus sp. JCM 10914]|uniref:hypothetical protein n=1 Tax=Paenibacillus sp. JCM 10914 TaxID=1236974 RepID=UPI0003CC2943|nr:hypothetical protein [Paenibacillus sp. JCM 10914]GAE05260.1 hypothetical protein JCM10914_1355 [Paenibacillus sp. JCM 10914]